MKLTSTGITIPRRKLLALTFLVSTSLAWFFVFYYSYTDIFAIFSTDPFWVYIGNGLLLILISVSAIAGTAVAERIDRRKLLIAWVASGFLLTLGFVAFQGILPLLILSVLLGVSFGIGLPASWAFLADCTAVEERGRVSGIVILVAFGLVILSLILVSALNLGVVEIVLLSVAIRLAGFATFALDPCQREKAQPKAWRAVFGYRDFMFYLIAYVLFNAANGLVSFVWAGLPSTPDYDWAFRFGTVMHYIGTAAFAIISGLVADRIGRKKPIIFGMVLLGIGYALVGLAPSPESLFIHMLVSGFAWGIIIVVYLAIPGDLSQAGSRERFYALGAIVPFILFMGFGGAAWLLKVPAVAALSTILSIVLFVSIIPVLYASETLPESKLASRRLKEHIEKIEEAVRESKEQE